MVAVAAGDTAYENGVAVDTAHENGVAAVAAEDAADDSRVAAVAAEDHDRWTTEPNREAAESLSSISSWTHTEP